MSLNPFSFLFRNGIPAERNLGIALNFLLIWLVCGFAFLLDCAFAHGYQNAHNSWVKTCELFSHEALLSLASGAVGGLIGFLFGIPRPVRQSEMVSTKSGGGKDSTNDGRAEHRNKNTNLVQISDWLTKIILGAGLTQVHRIPTLLGKLGEYLGPTFDNSAVLPILIVINSAVFGFFTGYVLTELFLVAALTEAETSSASG